jgi:hypothetical protein
MYDKNLSLQSELHIISYVKVQAYAIHKDNDVNVNTFMASCWSHNTTFATGQSQQNASYNKNTGNKTTSKHCTIAGLRR